MFILSGVYDKHGIESQVVKFGKYKEGWIRVTCKTMSEDICEMLTTLLDDIYSNWLDKVSSTRGAFAL